MRHRSAITRSSFLFACILALSNALASDAQPLARSTAPSNQAAHAFRPDVQDYLTSHTLMFSTTSAGVKKSIPDWGLDTSWPDPAHIWRGLDYMGKENVDVIRLSFPATDPLVDDGFPASKKAYFDSRLEMAKPAEDAQFTLMPDTEAGVNPWFKNGKEIIPERWAELIAAAQRQYGKKILWVEPFNEPDYGWGQGTIQNLDDILGLLSKTPELSGTQLAGPSTLNDDSAETWFQPLKHRLQRGTTHTLAGSFDNYVGFIRNVQATGLIADNPEAHDIVEVLVGAQYGLRSAIWRETAERSRGEFVKAQKGERLAYAEDRPRWSAAAVYRAPGGAIQAFSGVVERQGMTTNYRFVCHDRDVWFNGEGPRRDYTVSVGPNGESVVDIKWGQDIPPSISGRYVIVNRLSHKVLSVANAGMNDGAWVVQTNYVRGTHQQWDFSPDTTGDISYFTVSNVNSSRALDMYNWSSVDGGAADQWGNGSSKPEQWYFEYAGDNYFYIRSRWSTKCLQMAGKSTRAGAAIEQETFSGAPEQQWRLIPVSSWPIKFAPPTTPGRLSASTRTLAVALQWATNPDADIAGYTVFRSTIKGGPYETIARGVSANTFIDNQASEPRRYYYVVSAVDHSLNHSAFSKEVSAVPGGGRALVARYRFDGSLADSSGNGNEGAAGSPNYSVGRGGAQCLALNGTGDYVRMPSTAANSTAITVTTWVYCDGGDRGQRIFDLGNNAAECLFLTPRSVDGTLRLGVRFGSKEQFLDAAPLPIGKWVHVAVTLGNRTARLYVNGVLVARSQAWIARPNEFRPVFNYIGKSQSDVDPMLAGRLSDFRIYNYALSPDQIARLAKG